MKKLRLEAGSLIANDILPFYDLLTDEDFSIDNLISMAKHKDFKLLIQHGEEQVLSEDTFYDYHPHSFETPLLAVCHMAAEHIDTISDEDLVQLIQVLIEKGANVDACDNSGNTPLLLLAACSPEKNFAKAIQHLVDAGADINATNTTNQSALHRTMEKANFKLADAFYELGVKVTFDKKNHSHLIEILVCDPQEILLKFPDFLKHLQTHHLLAQPNKQTIFENHIEYSEIDKILKQQGPLESKKIAKILVKSVEDELLFIALIERLNQQLYEAYHFRFDLPEPRGFRPS